MSMTDPVSDLLIRIKNAAKAKHKAVDVPAARLKNEIARLLSELRFIKRSSVIKVDGKPILRIWLRYNKNDESIISGLERISRPGLRRYASADEMFRLQQEVGTMIVSTSSGIMTDQQALKNHIGGELVCRVW
ncbi:MAG: 30S ribosomal protein S8 [candidate division Zixibacteria bacterium]|nr:30S ribosomal protein S8 [candidate division Zixibacteria bacterium]